MDDSLRRESENLARSWARHDPAWLCDYLVAGVEDPRINLQSLLSRHFLIRQLTGDRFADLMTQECRFAAVMNWLLDFTSRAPDPEQFAVLLHALKHNADNAEGTEIQHCVRYAFSTLPARCGDYAIPNYPEQFLAHTTISNSVPQPHQPTLNTFQQIWHSALSPLTHHASRITDSPFRTTHYALRTLVEPACGSANDYRFLHSFGLGRFFIYTGFDLSEKNIQNARALFPDTRFEIANIFEIPAPDKSYDLCLVHDLFEHLSLAGLEIAVKEICRVSRRALCLGFFQMDEIPNHVVRPVDDYHVNLLSLARIKALFARYGFHAHVTHVGTFLRAQFGCDFTHNPYAYTLVLTAI